MKTSRPEEKMDLTGVKCPENSARTLLKLGTMEVGEVLEIVVDDGEAEKNIPPSVEEEGHSIILKERIDGQWRILIKKK